MPNRPRVLIIDDDVAGREALGEWMTDRGFVVAHAGSLAEADARLEEGTFALALIDLALPDGSGHELIERLDQSETDVIVVTGHGSIDSAIDAVRGGVLDYVEKPVDLERLAKIVGQVRRTFGLRRQVRSLRGELRRLGRFGQLVGSSPAIQQVYDLISKVAPTDSIALLVGETGSGKEVVAQSIHALSRRADKPFVPVNCGAVAPQLIENELFGHEKGSFTGADRQHKGVFEQAAGGTLFLDEITEMSPELQVKLLRVLETRQITRIGGDGPIDVDVRLIAATNRDPDAAVAEGKLRQDLKDRLDVFPIRVPPLRERIEDVPMLAEHFLERLNEQAEAHKRFSAAALRRLSEEHVWPGNVRELRNVVERAFILAGDARTIELDAMPLEAGTSGARPPAGANGNGTARAIAAVAASPRPGAGGDDLRIPIGSSIAKAEKEMILATLEREGGDKKATARTLGISVKTLYARLRLYEGGPD